MIYTTKFPSQASSAKPQVATCTDFSSIKKVRAMDCIPEYLGIMQNYDASCLQEIPSKKTHEHALEKKVANNFSYTASGAATNSNMLIDQNTNYYLATIKQKNHDNIVDNFYSNSAKENPLSLVTKVFQASEPEQVKKLQYAMRKKTSKNWLLPLNQENTNLQKAGMWSKYSYFNPFTLVMKDAGIDLSDCIYSWRSWELYFKLDLDIKLKKRLIDDDTYCQEFSKYEQQHINTVKYIFKQIITQLIKLNENGIFHFDIKPDNITINPQGQASLIDFQHALIDESTIDIEDKKFNQQYGALCYCPPEAINSLFYSYKRDSWSLGLSLCQSLIYEKIDYIKLVDSTLNFADYPEGLKFNVRSYFILCQRIIRSSDLNDNAKNLILQLLEIDPKKRLSPKDALKHPFFSEDTTCKLDSYLLHDQLFQQLCQLEKQEQETANQEDLYVIQEKISKVKTDIINVKTVINNI